MSSLRHELVLSTRASYAPSTPGQGGYVAHSKLESQLLSGTSADQADRVYHAQPTIAASGTLDVDLKTALDPYGVAIALVEVVTIDIRVPAGGGALRLQPGASNGWTALLDGTSPTLDLPAGSRLVLHCPANPAWAVGAADKVLTLVETGGSLAVQPEIIITGRSA